jgi:hypothetical protein
MAKVGCIILLVGAISGQSAQPSARANQTNSISVPSKPAPANVCVIPLLQVKPPKDREFPIKQATPPKNKVDGKDVVKPPVPECVTKPAVPALSQARSSPTPPASK